MSTTAAGVFSGMRIANAAALMDDAFDAAVQLIQDQIDSGKLESAEILIRSESETYGASLGKAAVLDATGAIFLIASITKPMSAAGIMILADRGELKLSDPVRKFIPEFSQGDRKDITIKQLLTHTSGLPDQLEENATLRAAHAPLKEFVKGAVRTPLLFKPGTKYSYQSMGILLASEIAERITKTPFRDFLKQELFIPLGMKHSALGMGEFEMADVVRGQIENAAKESGAGAANTKDWDWNSPYWRDFAAPWGGAHCTALDVTIFLRSFLHPDGKVLKRETALRMVRNQNPPGFTPRGLGFDLSPGSFGKSCSKRTFGHRGATGTLAWADPKKAWSCVILTSLPFNVSGELLLNPVSDLISGAAR
ncbi:MAG: serine hydrolase domain-containing protein [Verrucomicrobiota bacterium]